MLKERHVEFNVKALQNAAEISVSNKHGKAVSIRKLAEGGFNRVFIIQMQDEFELIAKIPYHVPGPKYFATASEAATLTFLKSQDIPVPEVYGYSVTADNPVGAEYILMEKVAGVCLATKWEHLQDLDIRRLANSFVEIETKLFKIHFGATGSLYFKKDIAPNLQVPLHTGEHTLEEDQFCIGPIADYMFWFGRRMELQANRGPWKSPVEYLQSIADKEMDWTKRYGKPMKPDFPHNALELGAQAPEDYLQLLESYQLLAPHLLPKSPAHILNQPILRHPDLTPGNIFISPETGRITCLIDWQHAVIQPNFLAAGYPRAFENPDVLRGKLVEPKLPENITSLTAEAQAAAHELYRKRYLFYVYRALNGHFNTDHLAALRDPLLQLRQLLVDRAGHQWGGNLVTLKGAIIPTTQFWNLLPDVEKTECPIHFSQVELDKFAETEEDWLKMSITVEQWRHRVCCMTAEGWVRNEEYEEAKAKLDALKEEIWSQCEGDEEDMHAFKTGWLFRDREEIIQLICPQSQRVILRFS